MATFDIRKAKEQDLERLAFIHTMGHKQSHIGSVSQDYIDSLSVDDGLKNWTKWYSEGRIEDAYITKNDNDEDMGFVWFGPLRTPPPGMSPIRPLYTREIYGLYVLKDYWGQGAGQALMNHAFQTMKDQKHNSVCLWVLKKNKRANDFYQKMGGERCGKMKSEMGGQNVVESCFGWRKIKI